MFNFKLTILNLLIVKFYIKNIFTLLIIFNQIFIIKQYYY